MTLATVCQATWLRALAVRTALGIEVVRILGFSTAGAAGLLGTRYGERPGAWQRAVIVGCQRGLVLAALEGAYGGGDDGGAGGFVVVPEPVLLDSGIASVQSGQAVEVRCAHNAGGLLAIALRPLLAGGRPQRVN